MMSNYPEATTMFVEAGRLLWGENWHAHAARALGLNLRTVQRFDAAAREGKREVLPREGLMEDLRDLLDENGGACLRLRDKFDGEYEFLPRAELFSRS